MEQKKLFKDKYIGYHTLGLKLDDVKSLGNINYKLVDLGLPSGTLWADRNIGAKNLQDLGLYFRWGETKGQVDTKEKVPYKYGSMADSSDPEFTYSKYNAEDNLFVLESGDDAATENMGKNWYMPNINQINELLNNTTKEVIFDDNGIPLGISFVSTINGKSIYFPLPSYDPRNTRISSSILSNDLFYDRFQQPDYLRATDLYYAVDRKDNWHMNCYSGSINRESFSHVRGVYSERRTT